MEKDNVANFNGYTRLDERSVNQYKISLMRFFYSNFTFLSSKRYYYF